ncbi:MAG TPA: hypothetical protein VF708_08580 [Pyrinomonadaceae bacterium]
MSNSSQENTPQQGNAVSQGNDTGAPTGVWGGAHIRLNLTKNHAEIEYDCAHGTIEEPLALDDKGRFDAKGTLIAEHGGPVRRNESPRNRPARYTGHVNGETMTLTVTLTDTNETLNTFTLTHGSEGRVMKCR